MKDDRRRLLIYDATDKSYIGQSWRVGAFLFQGLFDSVVGVKDIQEARDAFGDQGNWWDEIQIWGHGAAGAPMIGRSSFRPDEKWRASLVWFRSCYVLRGQAGYEFAFDMAQTGTAVAGHTRLIGPWGMHSGLYALHENQDPWWSIHDKGGSAPWLPRTIPATEMELPPWAFTP